MLKDANSYFGIPARIYRSATEIRRDMENISDRINDANEKLNLRSLLVDFIDVGRDAYSGHPAFWIPELEAALREARAAYESLSALNLELTMLEEELRETRCAMGL